MTPRPRARLRLAVAIGGLGVVTLVLTLVPVGGGAMPDRPAPARTPRLDLAGVSAAAPAARLWVPFIHHSCGGQLLAEPGADVGTKCIYRSHPNGGGLRRALEGQGRSDFLAYTGSDATDAHPARQGNEAAAREFVPFLNRAARRAGLSE